MSPAAGKPPRNIPIAGFIDAANRQTGVQLLPLAWAAAGPSGRVTRDAFERMCALLLDALAHARPDAIYLDLHGAMAAEHVDDADGEILRRVRAAIGPQGPLAACLRWPCNCRLQTPSVLRWCRWSRLRRPWPSRFAQAACRSAGCH